MFCITGGARQYPLLPQETMFIATIIQLERIRQCLTPSQGLTMINLMMQDTLVQENLIKFKQNHSHINSNPGKLGADYWAGFRSRTKDQLVKKIQN